MRIIHKTRKLKGEIYLKGSKSESNRALMIAAYAGLTPDIDNLSDSQDTQILASLLETIDKASGNDPTTIYCHNAGTICRFLMTYLAQKQGVWLLTGDNRLINRPIAALVEGLRTLGADINYLDKEGSLPIMIKGKHLNVGDVEIDMTESSQFASSLLLMMPTLNKETLVRLRGDERSMPYIDMTIGVMNRYGAKVSRDGKSIKVLQSAYQHSCFKVSPDWSSASYWFEAVALSDDAEIVLKGLSINTLQGDEAVRLMFNDLGLCSRHDEGGIVLTKGGNTHEQVSFDFRQTPDLFPSLAVTCAALCQKAVFTGIRNLRYKESDRVETMVKELSRLGASFEVADDKVVMTKGLDKHIKPHAIETYNDHRLVMAFSMLSLIYGSVDILGFDAAHKSYKSLASDLQSLGFEMDTDC